MSADWRYYLLTQLDQPSPGSHLGRWEIQQKPLYDSARGTAIEPWDKDDLRFFRALNPDDTSMLIVGVRSNLPLDLAMERIAERLGIVEPVRAYTEMSIHELQAERTRLHELLLHPYAFDPAKSLEIFHERRADENNPINQELDEVENLMKQKGQRSE